MNRYNKMVFEAPNDGTAQTNFSAEYVKELRQENKSLRLSLRDYETETPKLKSAVEENTKATEAAIKDALKSANDKFSQKILASELKSAATKAGIVDIDALKMFDTSLIKINENGDVEIPADFFEKAKEAKPFLFKANTGVETGTTSQTQQAPKPQATTIKHVSQMTADELAVYEKSIGL